MIKLRIIKVKSIKHRVQIAPAIIVMFYFMKQAKAVKPMNITTVHTAALMTAPG